jgi:DNA-binding winged helix-turn-helix (wHTH) protein/TolB-like protein/Tfp pilus assembly protein PilF
MSTANQTPGAWPDRTNRAYEFGPFLLDTDRQLLLKELQPIALTPKSYDTLLVLVESGGRLLSKEELMKALWPDSFVEESNLTQQISMIRKTLGESPGEDRYIVTVQGRGYRFAAPVKPFSNRDSQTAAQAPLSDRHVETTRTETGTASAAGLTISSGLQPSSQPEAGGRGVLGRRRIALLVLALLGAVAVLALVYTLRRKESSRAQSSQGPRSLAIIPFRNLRQDADSDFLGFSLADAVATKLSYVSALTVRSSSAVEKYRDQIIDIQKVATDLNVDSLLTGNFVREGDDLRITAELIDVRTQRILWKEAFDLKYEKLLTIQESVAQQIVKGLEVNLSPTEAERLKGDRPIDPLAYEYYLRGVDLYSRSDFPMAIKMLEKSTELNPKYALTWAHLGRAYDASASFKLGGREQYQKAEEAYEKALSLQPAQIEARVYMANMFTDTGRVEQAVPLLREALKANPNHAEAHWELGYAYRFAGALQESVSECERARQLDPSVKLNSSAPNSYLYLGQYDKFLQSLPKTDDSALIVFYRGFGEYYRQNLEQAAREFDRAFELDPLLLHAQIGKALSYGVKNQEKRGLEILHTAENKIHERGVGDPEAIYKIAQAYSLLGDRASALRVLQYSIETGFFSYPYLANDPLLHAFRGDREFDRMMEVARRRQESFKARFL